MRFALLGAGRIGKLHARLLSETEGVSELLVADVERGRESVGSFSGRLVRRV